MDFSQIGVIYTSNRLFVQGLALISKKFGNFDENVAQRAGLKN